MTGGGEWAAARGDTWARRWRDTDRALSPIGDALVAAVVETAPNAPFTAFDIGCGAGATSLALAASRPDATIIGCDLSAALIEVAQARAAGLPSVRFRVGDAVAVAEEEGPFDLFLSRHGVMFFRDPPAAFAAFRASARSGASLIFSCFRGWDSNPWASELASAAAGRTLPPPGREPSGFAFADPAYVAELLEAGGWSPAAPRPVDFSYVAGEGASAVDEALGFLTDIGPASSAVGELPPAERPAGVERMRAVIERHRQGDAVRFPAAAWIWSATAA